jgi:putative tributyrin esterase
MSAEGLGWPEVSFRTIEISDPRFERAGLRHITVKSAALGQRADLTVHATPAARAAADVPVVILLHGVYGSHWAWTEQGGAHETAARMEADGEIPPVVLAMPSDGLWGDGSGYLRHRTQDFERWIAWEVVAAVARAVPAVTPKSRVCIAGLSMGGFGALRLAARFPEKFAAASGHSSITHFDQMSQFVEEQLGSYTALAEDRSVLDVMLRHRDRLPPIRFDCGTSDPLIKHNRELHQALERAGVTHVYEEFTGGHEWPYWETHFADSLRFFAKALKT